MDSELHYPESKMLPPLYTTAKNGKEWVWKVWVVGNTVHWTTGTVDGKKTPHQRSFKGVNKGKANETSDEEQASERMYRMWIKQLDKNYRPKCSEGKKMYAEALEEKKKHGGANRTASMKISGKKASKKSSNLSSPDVEVNIIPMKANSWKLKDSKNPTSVLPNILKHFDFSKGVYVQWKLDGYRCAARLQSDGKVILSSNSSKQFPWFSHLREQVKTFLSTSTWEKSGCIALDCELYVHVLQDEKGKEVDSSARFSTFQKICGISRLKPNPIEGQICLYVFDLIDNGEKTQTERFQILKKLFSNKKCPSIRMVKTHLVHSVKDVVYWHGKFAEEGYEGIIIRDQNLRYRQKHRSLKMGKFKYFEDAEYTVIDTFINSGVEKENFVWVCQTADGKEFKVKPKGTREQRLEWYKNRMNYIGRRLTVEFQEYTDDGVPRFPRGKAFRDAGDI